MNHLPYTKKSGIKIDKYNPYFVAPHIYKLKIRKRPTRNQYSQFIGHYDYIHHKFVVKVHIIHEKN